MTKERKPLIPLYVDLTDKKVMVAGRGEAGARMLRYLGEFTDSLYYLTPDEQETGHILPGGVTVLRKDYERSDLYGMDYVVSVLEDRRINEDIYVTGRTLGIRVCISSEPKRCDFHLGDIG